MFFTTYNIESMLDNEILYLSSARCRNIDKPKPRQWSRILRQVLPRRVGIGAKMFNRIAGSAPVFVLAIGALIIAGVLVTLMVVGVENKIALPVLYTGSGVLFALIVIATVLRSLCDDKLHMEQLREAERRRHKG